MMFINIFQNHLKFTKARLFDSNAGHDGKMQDTKGKQKIICSYKKELQFTIKMQLFTKHY